MHLMNQNHLTATDVSELRESFPLRSHALNTSLVFIPKFYVLLQLRENNRNGSHSLSTY